MSSSASAAWVSGFPIVVDPLAFIFNSIFSAKLAHDMGCTNIDHNSIPDLNIGANASSYNLLPFHLTLHTHKLGSERRKA